MTSTPSSNVGADASRGWQPISTVPSNGLIVVIGGIWDGEVYGIDRDEKGPWLVDADGFTVHGTDCYVSRIIDPTHWFALPTPPAGETK